MDDILELMTVALTRDLPEHGLAEGDVGTVVHRYTDDHAYEVEFVTGLGETLAVVLLKRNDLRLLNRREILHVRTLA